MLPLVLIVEDEEKTAALVDTYLRHEGFDTVAIHDGARALDCARQIRPSLVILDLMLPNQDGWEICRRLREISDIPILILTARQEEIDRVLGLTLGADDYVVKPFSPRELVARVKAILRRVRYRAFSLQTTLQQGELQINTEQHTVRLGTNTIELTPSEFKLLHILMAAPGRVFSRNELLDRLYSDNDEVVVDRIIDVYIGTLRRKIETDSNQPRYLITVRGVGYKFTPNDGPNNG